MNKLFYFCLFMLGIGLYFDTARDLMLSRGGFYIGGEAAFLFLPLLAYLIVSVFGGEKE